MASLIGNKLLLAYKNARRKVTVKAALGNANRVVGSRHAIASAKAEANAFTNKISKRNAVK